MSQQNTIGKHATNIINNGDMIAIIYHSTPVVSFDAEKIILNSGGWRTATTKTRMNQTSKQFDLGFRVYQKNFDWFIDYNGQTYDFIDNVQFERY